MDNKQVLVHYINVAGKSKTRAKQQISEYMHAYSGKLDVVEYFIPITSGADSRIEWLKQSEANKIEGAIPSYKKIRSKAVIILEHYLAKYNFENYDGDSIMMNIIDEDIKSMINTIHDISPEVYAEVFPADAIPIGFLAPDTSNHVIEVFVDLDNMMTSIKMIKTSTYYKYLQRVAEINEENLGY